MGSGVPFCHCIVKCLEIQLRFTNNNVKHVEKASLNIFILVIHIHSLRMDESILYLKGLPIEINENGIFLFLLKPVFFILAISADTDEMPPSLFTKVQLKNKFIPQN